MKMTNMIATVLFTTMLASASAFAEDSVSPPVTTGDNGGVKQQLQQDKATVKADKEKLVTDKQKLRSDRKAAKLARKGKKHKKKAE